MINEIPSYVTIEESYLFLIESAERDFNTMWSSLAINEYNQISSSNVFNESGDSEKKGIKGLIDNIINWIKARWNDITKFFQKVMDEIHKKTDELKSKIAKSTLKWIPKKLNKLKNKTYGKTYEFPNFDDLMNTGGPILKKIEDYAVDVISTVQVQTQNAEARKTQLENLDADFKKSLGVDKDANDSAVKDAMKKEIYGAEVEITRDYIKSNYEEMVSDCADFSKLQRQLKNNLKSLKKAFDNNIKQLKSAAKESDKKIENANYSSGFSAAVPYIKKTHNYISTASSVILGATRAKVMKEIGIIIRLAFKFGKDQTGEEKKEEEEKDENLKESRTYQSEMASLFNFNI